METKYKSAWDKSTFAIITFIAVISCSPLYIISDIETADIIISLTSLTILIAPFFTVYYTISDKYLTVHTLFSKAKYPISKIKAIQPTKTWLSAPATSLTNRIAITFTDKSILKSTLPLIISPSNRAHFLAHLRSINPSIALLQ